MKPEFKATKENLAKLIVAANNTESDGEFIQAGESIVLKDHPLCKEVKDATHIHEDGSFYKLIGVKPHKFLMGVWRISNYSSLEHDCFRLIR